MAQLAASLAHEMVHAYHRMTRSTPDPTLPRHARANAFIEEEIATREKEKTILKEILAPGKRKALETAEKKAKSAGLREQSTKQIATQSTFTRASGTRFCFRNKRNGSRNVCYRGSDQQSLRAKNLDDVTIQKSEDLVRSLVFTAPLDEILRAAHPGTLTKDKDTGQKTKSLSTEFAELLLMRRVIEEHWQTSGADIESILESHRKALSQTTTQQANFTMNR